MSADEPWHDATEELGRDLRGLRIGVVRDHFLQRVQSDVAEAFELALPAFAELGAEVVDVNWPEAAAARAAGLIINRVEAVSVHDDAILHNPEGYARELRLRNQANRLFPSAGYLKALKVRVLIRESIARVFADNRLDAIVVPTLPGTAAPADDTFITYDDGSRESVAFGYTRLCTVFNLTGQPALSINAGFDRSGLPIGITIAGRPFGEARICRIGQAFEQARGLHRNRPALLGNE